jgi:hypothetical protein
MENVPAARFQPKARGRYRTRSVAVPKRRVCKAKPPQTVEPFTAAKKKQVPTGACFFFISIQKDSNL